MMHWRIVGVIAVTWAMSMVAISATARDIQRVLPTSHAHVQLSYAPIVKKVSPAVVNIYTKRRVKVRQGVSPLMNDPFFGQFFGQGRGMRGMTRERVVSSLGSGVIVAPSGMVVTSQHVIDKSEDIVVVLSDGNEYKAKLLLQDEASDLAVLQMKGKKQTFPYVPLTNSDSLEVGDLVLALGNPFGVGQTVTSGIVSALARSAGGVSDYQFFIQTDAAINPGNSGGALVNLAGQLVGVNTAIYSRSGGSNGIGFAIPSNMVKAVLRSAERGGKSLLKPWLGASYQDVTPDIAESQGLKAPQGALITKLHDRSPAGKAGLEVGDIITSFDGSVVNTVRELMFRVAIAPVDKPVRCLIVRGEQKLTKTIRLTYPPAIPAADPRVLKGKHPLTGLTVGNLSPRLASEVGLAIDEKGVVVIKSASRFGVMKGDVIVSVNGKVMKTSKQLYDMMKSLKREWNVTYKRAGRLINLSASL